MRAHSDSSLASTSSSKMISNVTIVPAICKRVKVEKDAKKESEDSTAKIKPLVMKKNCFPEKAKVDDST